MQIKSWQIALVGVLINSLTILYYLNISTEGHAPEFSMGILFMTLVVFVPAIISLITAILLRTNENYKKIGAIISIFLCLAWMIIFYFYVANSDISIDDLLYYISPVFIPLFAGIHYFWKKV